MSLLFRFPACSIGYIGNSESTNNGPVLIYFNLKLLNLGTEILKSFGPNPILVSESETKKVKICLQVIVLKRLQTIKIK